VFGGDLVVVQELPREVVESMAVGRVVDVMRQHAVVHRGRRMEPVVPQDGQVELEIVGDFAGFRAGEERREAGEQFAARGVFGWHGHVPGAAGLRGERHSHEAVVARVEAGGLGVERHSGASASARSSASSSAAVCTQV